MKMTCPQSIKFLKLKRRLKLTHWQTVGLLESLWLFTQMNAPAGDIGKRSNEDIAATIEWEGDPDGLIDDLIGCGFIDRSESHRLLVHDWIDHVPNYLRGAMKVHGKEFAKQDAKQPARHGAKQDENQPQADCSSTVHPSLALGSVGLPSVEIPPNPQGGTGNGQVPVDGSTGRKPKADLPYSEDFERFWLNFSPVRKGNKPDAWKAWQAAIKSTEPQTIITAAIDFALSPMGLGEYCPGPAPWLRGRRWEDDRTSWLGSRGASETVKPPIRW